MDNVDIISVSIKLFIIVKIINVEVKFIVNISNIVIISELRRKLFFCLVVGR